MENTASMRPRFANRGSETRKVFQFNTYRASMRPRFANRGSGMDDDTRRGNAGRFNEAPIRESGK